LLDWHLEAVMEREEENECAQRATRF